MKIFKAWQMAAGKNRSALVSRLALLSVILFFGLFITFSDTGSGLLRQIDKDDISYLVKSAGNWGPALIVGLMMLAVVFSPLPSAPIAIAAGVVYGHSWGTLFVVIGASLGAIIAFSLSRWMGQGIVDKMPRLPGKLSRLLTQQSLFLAILTARIIPFVSFDAVSYAAGLTKISLLNFSIATMLGLIPMSFFLAHIGDQWAVSQENEPLSWVFLLGLFTFVPIAGYIWKRVQGDKRLSK